MAMAPVTGTVEKGISDSIMTLQKVYDTIIEYLVKYGFQVLGGIIILIIGWKLASWVAKLVFNACEKKKLDVTLNKFLSGIVKSVIMIFATLMALEKFGVTISPLIASISAAIFGASFAIQAPLSNYAAGLSVIITRPFVVGNTITVKGVHGVVEEVKLPCTILKNAVGEKITIPNKDIVGEILWNSHELKAVDLVVGISYDDDPEVAIKTILETLKKFPKVSQSPGPQVGVLAFGDFSVNIDVQYWVPTREYKPVMFSANLAIYKAIKEAKITIPFPRRDVHTFSH